MRSTRGAWPLLPPLAFAALMLISAMVFHLAPVIWTRGRFPPGLIAALILFHPIGTGVFLSAAAGELTGGRALAALGIAALRMTSPVAFLHLRRMAHFRQAP